MAICVICRTEFYKASEYDPPEDCMCESNISKGWDEDLTFRDRCAKIIFRLADYFTFVAGKFWDYGMKLIERGK